MPWRHQICIASCLYSYRDNLPKHLFKITAQDRKKSTSGLRASHKTLLFKPPNSFSIYSETLTMYQTLPFYETCSRLDTKKIRLKEIGTLSALRNALQNTLFPFLNAPPLRFEGGETTASTRLLFHRACTFTLRLRQNVQWNHFLLFRKKHQGL